MVLPSASSQICEAEISKLNHIKTVCLTKFSVIDPHEVLEEGVDVLLGGGPHAVHLHQDEDTVPRHPGATHLLHLAGAVGLEAQGLFARAIARLLPGAGARPGPDVGWG